MITKRGEHIHLLERMLGVTSPKVLVTSLARSALILINTHIFTFGGATVTKSRLQVHLLKRSLVATSRQIPRRHNHAVTTWLTNIDSSTLEEAYYNKRTLWLLISRLKFKFFLIKVFISMNLFKTIKTSSGTYSKSVKPVVKRSNLCLKMRLIEGVTELRKSRPC